MRLGSQIVVMLVFAAGAVAQARAGNVRVVYPVPTITIYAGDEITLNLLTKKRFRLSRSAVSSYVRVGQDVVGKVARRTLIAGRPIPRNALHRSKAVTEGSRVTLVFGAGRLTITGVGKAVQSGSVGDTISVKNVDSGRLVRGVVRKDGAIDVGGL